MKQFVKKAVVFLLPILCWFFLEGIVPSSTYTYRPWEAERFQSHFSLGEYFHPNEETQMKSAGDLCYYTRHARFAEEDWKTDRMGNRNNYFIFNPDIIIMGDSFVVGCDITQDSTITNLLPIDFQDKLKIYNIATAGLAKLDYYLKSGFIKKPKLVIYMQSEKFMPVPIKKYPNSNSLKTRIKRALLTNSVISYIRVFGDKIFREYSKNWVQARLSNRTGTGIPGKAGDNMYFMNIAADKLYNDPNWVHHPTDFKKTTKTILSYKKYCDSLGINFIYVPMPNKSTVYYDDVDLNMNNSTAYYDYPVPADTQPDYVVKLVKSLQVNHVNTINTLKLYNDYRKTHSALLYHLDDDHWNSNSVKLVANKLKAKICKDFPQLSQGINKENKVLSERIR